MTRPAGSVGGDSLAEYSGWLAGIDAPSEADLSKCVHCGLCLNACPTYLVTGLETESPRGRIALARRVGDGEITVTPSVERHWDQCLQCRACEAVCPSAVPYGRIMEGVRAQMAARNASSGLRRRLSAFALRNIVARPRVLAMAMAPARAWANSSLRTSSALRKALRILPLLGRAEAQLPTGQGAPARACDFARQGGDVELFTGCVMQELFGNVHRATAALLGRRGMRVSAAREQGCCGALHAHNGDIAFARRLARRNIDAFEASATAPIIVNSAGCGAAMKEYGELLAGDPAYHDRASRFSRRVRDLSEVLGQHPVPARFDGRVSYQHACHLAHAQRLREQPLDLVRGVEGAVTTMTTGDDTCCGAAGIYSLLEPRMSGELRDRKAEIFRRVAPDVVVTANPGCHMQYSSIAGPAGPFRVMHLAEFLDDAERRAAMDPAPND